MPEPKTGIVEIDDEILRASETMSQVRSLCRDFDTRADCGDCAKAHAECEQRLGEMVPSVLDLLYGHFVAEEVQMRARGFAQRHPERFALHVEDHASILEGISNLIADLERASSLVSVRRLHGLVEKWLREHIGKHDLALANSLQAG
jgi:hemerythrin